MCSLAASGSVLEATPLMRDTAFTRARGTAAESPGGARAPDAAGGMGFPDVPRLELDQLPDRADDVLATQGRLRGLVRANAMVAGELSLPVVLRQIVAAARGDLLGARYAAWRARPQRRAGAVRARRHGRRSGREGR